jgi:hypothetical protein
MMLMFLGHRIADRRLLGLICKWLQAGIMEEGRRVVSESRLCARFYISSGIDRSAQAVEIRTRHITFIGMHSTAHRIRHLPSAVQV